MTRTLSHISLPQNSKKNLSSSAYFCLIFYSCALLLHASSIPTVYLRILRPYEVDDNSFSGSLHCEFGGVTEKDSQLVGDKREKIKYLVSKAKKESSDDETPISKSEDEVYAMAVKNFKKFIRRQDVDIQITLSENVQNRQNAKTKRPLLEACGVTIIKKK
ncbi:hypothetical protein Tco_0307964 [Tanacetum coccineum]